MPTADQARGQALKGAEVQDGAAENRAALQHGAGKHLPTISETGDAQVFQKLEILASQNRQNIILHTQCCTGSHLDHLESFANTFRTSITPVLP